MTEPQMPTPLPSPVDRSDFRFVAVDAHRAEWHWVDDEMIWVRAPGETDARTPEVDGCDVVH